MNETVYTIECWKCGEPVPIAKMPMWGVHLGDCMAATGLDGLRYNIVPMPGWPEDDPSGPRYVATLTTE